VSESKTHVEIRNKTVDRELFGIPEQMQKAMDEARLDDERRFPAVAEAAIDEERNNFRPYDQNQDFFITVSKNSFLEEKHPARIVDLIVEGLDLSGVYAQYSHEGNLAYHPRMMLKVLFYAYYVGVMSARTIWDCVINRADFIYLAAGQVPNFRTINSFRVRHLKELPDLFTQIVLLCKQLGMIGFEHMAIDGQKIHANANFRKSKNLKGLKSEYAKVKAGIQKLLAKEVNEYLRQETKEKRIDRLSRKLEKLGELRQQLQAFKDEEKRLNTSDPDAPVMRHKDGTSKPSYNHQSAVDGKCGVTTAVRTTQASDKGKDLLEVVDASNENTKGGHASVSADSGFCDYDMLEKGEQRPEQFYVPDKGFEKAKKDPEEKNKYGPEDFPKDDEGNRSCPAGKPMKPMGQVTGSGGQPVEKYEGTACEGCPKKSKCTTAEVRTLSVDAREGLRDRMREKLMSDKGREIYMKRQGLVEPTHGDDQKNRGWRQHHLRGLEKATAEFTLIRIAANLGKIIKYRADEMLAWRPS